MQFNATNSNVRRLPIEWLETPGAVAAEVALRSGRRPFVFEAPRCGSRRRGLFGARRRNRFRAFTLLELMLVLAIIGFLAAVALPHVAGFNKANTVTAATRQLVDDIARARSRAIANRSTVYMVFLPAYWNLLNAMEQEAQVQFSPQFTNLLGHQYAAYALYSSRTVGDQPGRHFPHYLTEWQTLPTGTYIWPAMFSGLNYPVTISTTNTTANTTNADLVYPFATNVTFSFPSINSGAQLNLPYIGFTPQGTLVTQTNQYIVLTRGSVFYAEDTNGVLLWGPPNTVETPPGNETNNPCLIKVDWLTARATIVQNQF